MSITAYINKSSVDGDRSLIFSEDLNTGTGTALTPLGRRVKRQLLRWKPDFSFGTTGNRLLLSKAMEQRIAEIKDVACAKFEWKFECAFDSTLGILTIRSSHPFLEEDLKHFQTLDNVYDVKHAEHDGEPLDYVVRLAVNAEVNSENFRIHVLQGIKDWMRR